VSGLEIACAVALALATWHFAGYPLVLFVLAAARRRPALPAVEPRERVAMIVAAFNEERVIAAKIENALSLDYPPELFKVVIAADGSSDRTAEIARSFADPRVVCLHGLRRTTADWDGGHFLLETACDTIAELHILGHVGLPARHCPGQWTGLADPAWRPIQRRCRRRADPEGKLTVGTPEAAA